MIVLAHDSGWDEILLIAGPVAVIAVLLVLANRRANRIVAKGESDTGKGLRG